MAPPSGTGPAAGRRGRTTSPSCSARARDIRYFEAALAARGIRTYVYKGLGFFDAPEVQDVQALVRYLAQPESDLRAAELLRSRLVRISDTGLASLAPGLADALRSAELPPDTAGLDAADRELLETARVSLARWRELADRIAPSELLDRVLRESAYLFELRGPRLDQARENLKKMRALIRRIENRGYATLGRIAEHFETLRAGDESHAVVEAAGCVNLMTVHAAKGLEFPVVFLVNLHLPGRGRSSAFSVIERGPDGEPEVAFGASDATRLEDAHEREELRRLFYVAVTRSRDRLYLAAEVDPRQHTLRTGPRSLASLLPSTLAELFHAAAVSPAATELEWVSGPETFAFRVCRPSSGEMRESTARTAGAQGDGDATPRVPVALTSVSARSGVAGTTPRATPAQGPAPPDDRLVGTLVHRLLQRQLDPHLSESAIAERVPRVLRAEELVDIGDRIRLSLAVARTYVNLRSRPEVVKLLAAGRCHYEVPVSFQPPGPPVIVRGRIDCLVERPDGTLLVLEFKTGRPRAEHREQVELYREALGPLFPGRLIETRILYG